MSPSDSTHSGPRSVLVVGAGGFLGRAVVRSFADAGWEVRGLVRDPAKGELVRARGGVPVIGDVLDPATLAGALRGCDIAIHLAAHPSRDEDEARVRVEGSRRLVASASEAGLRRLVLGSGYWVYASRPDPIEEDAAVEPRGESRVNFDAERAFLEAAPRDSIDRLVVRPGMVYGDGSWFRDQATAIRDGRYRVVGDGRNRWSFVDVADAADAFVRVVVSGVSGSTYNVADGHPAPLREFVDFVAGQLGVPPPDSLPLDQAEAEFGDDVARHLAADRPVSGQRLRTLGWTPRFATYRDGVPPVLREMFPRRGR